ALLEQVELAAEGVLVDHVDVDLLAHAYAREADDLGGEAGPKFLCLGTCAEALAVLDAEGAQLGRRGGVEGDQREGHGAEDRAAAGFIEAPGGPGVLEAHGATCSNPARRASTPARVVARSRRASALGAEAVRCRVWAMLWRIARTWPRMNFRQLA